MRFERICEGQPGFSTGPRPAAGGIEHRLTQPNHPWSQDERKTIRWIVLPTGGQVERMNRTIRDATVKRFHDDSQGDLPAHLGDLLAAYTFARRPRTRASHGSRPGGEPRPALTPHEYTCKISTAEPDRFILDPITQMPELNSQRRLFDARPVVPRPRTPPVRPGTHREAP